MDNEETLTNKLLNFIEKDRFSLTSAIIYLFIIGGIRSLMEGRVGSYHGYGRYLFTQHVLLSYPQLLFGVLIIYIIIRKSPKKIMNFFLLGFGLLLLPPLVDYLIFGDIGIQLGAQYDYLAVDEILPTLFRAWNPVHLYNVGSQGQGLMFLGLMFGSAAYVALKTRLNQKILKIFKNRDLDRKKLVSSFIQTISTYFGIYFLMIFIYSFNAILRWDFKNGNYIIFNYFKVPFDDPLYYRFLTSHYDVFYISPPHDTGVMGLAQTLVINQSRLIYSSFFIVLAIISTILILYLSQKKRFVATLKNLPKRNTILFSLSAFIGISSVHMIDPDFSKGYAIDPTYLLHMPYIFFSLLVIALLTFFSYFIKRIYMYNSKDESLLDQYFDDNLNKYHYKHLSASSAITALYFSIILGYISFIISIIWIISCILLTTKEKNLFRKNLKTTIYGALSFFLGFYTPNAWRAYIVDPRGEVEVIHEVVYRTPPFTSHVFLIVIWLLVSFWYINYITNSDEIKMDLFSQLSETRNQQLALGIILILLLFPLIFFTSLTGLVIFIGPAVATPIWYKILEKNNVISFGLALQFLLFTLALLYIY